MQDEYDSWEANPIDNDSLKKVLFSYNIAGYYKHNNYMLVWIFADNQVNFFPTLCPSLSNKLQSLLAIVLFNFDSAFLNARIQCPKNLETHWFTVMQLSRLPKLLEFSSSYNSFMHVL